ncbi:ABC transporter ATP-binding protein [Metabacillus sediminilitoris]|uniref:ABC transporter ATP-binding protein n=1 Tax=Metabacillus sediminilitoris TaxID=2567941 RepID=A0A4S4BZ83_9BACI|nr:ABC transporter ATP-binding protein [Metabacillus sediminilitoris]QGQ47159.1 ATP-binding cassette domain-containing protein [Metabacillus sediminilitoris]THF80503.1 ABC transporter ATP-binding protein [Metabacillus sediminilitoris]
MSILTLQDISKTFSGIEVIKNLNMQVNDGEFVSILGPSGSGKSTLFSLIGGILTPEKGTILLEDDIINGRTGSISYMPQSSSLLPWRTVLQNVLLGQELTAKKNKEKAMQMLEKAGLTSYVHAYPHELSGGMKQRVSFIRALLSPQPLILLDEPFSALDELTRLDMQKWLLSMWENNRQTVLFITHNIEEALFLSDRIVILSNKPASIVSEFVIPFKRPRDEELFLTEEFLEWRRKIYRTLKV